MSEPHKRVVSTERFTRPEHLGPYSQGVVANGFLFTIGITARDERGDVVGPNEVVGQARQVFTILGAIAEAAGATLDDVVQLNIYLRTMEDANAVRDVRQEFWSSAPPASTTIAIADLFDADTRIEINAVAAIPPS